SSRRVGCGAGPPSFSGRSHTRICPRLLPAATLRVEPSQQTDVTQSASQGSVQARAALSKLTISAISLSSAHQLAQRLRPFRRGPDRPGADKVLGPRVDAQGAVNGSEQVALADGVVLDVLAVEVGRAIHLAPLDAAAGQDHGPA